MSAAMLCGCDEGLAFPEPVDPTTLTQGEFREVELRFMRLDVTGFEKTNRLEDLRRMPRRILEEIWLFDLELGPLMLRSLEQLRGLPAAEVDQLPQAARNMHGLLTLTPDSIELEGTNLEELGGLSGSVGIPTAKAFANLLNIGVTDDLIPPQIMADALLDDVIATHPLAQFRAGKPDAEHPDGQFAVAPRSIPLTLADVVTNFEGLADRFGPQGEHPGFMVTAKGVSVVEEDFEMISKVNVNALPFKGLDLTSASTESINSIGGQVTSLHDYSSPDWIDFKGLIESPKIEELTFSVTENGAFIPGGTSRDPLPNGDSPAWDLPKWEFEYLIVDMTKRATDEVAAHCNEYQLATGVAAFTTCIDATGWVELETFNNIGTPPDPAYLWDLDLELAQVRLHDGGLAEGDADIELAVTDIEVGVSAERIVEQVKENIQANPEVLAEFAKLLTDNTTGDADFYYYRSDAGDDWLYFINAGDVRIDDEGAAVREYSYANPGFFTDPGLQRASATMADVDGDTSHLKVKVAPGDVLYVQDDDGRVFELELVAKPSRARLGLVVTRVQ